MSHSTALEATINVLLTPGKGLLAADESFPTIEKRFKDLSLPSTEETRQAYREMLFTTPALGEFISGVILFDETLRQKSGGGSMVEAIIRQGMIPGIKVDQGTMALPCLPGEKVTRGLDSLRDRLIEYRRFGARFTKWRAVIEIGPYSPTHACIGANARALAVFAGLSLEAGLVPIIEPEVLMEGDHAIERTEEVMTQTLRCVFNALLDYRVPLEQLLLKTGMVLSGAECPEQTDIEAVAEATLRCFHRAVPAAMPGIVFLSGGQSDEMATRRLNAICGVGPTPWRLSFSFGRALQAPALKAWNGSKENVAAAQTALRHRARCNSAALQGRYTSAMEEENPCHT